MLSLMKGHSGEEKKRLRAKGGKHEVKRGKRSVHYILP